VSAGLARVDDDGVGYETIDEGVDAEVGVGCWAGDGGAEVGVTFAVISLMMLTNLDADNLSERTLVNDHLAEQTGDLIIRKQLREVSMKRVAVLAVALAALCAVAQPVSAQDLASSIVGTWKLTSFARKDVATGKTAATYGEHPPGYAYYTKGGRFQIFVVSQDRKKNEKPEPSDAERIELFKSMFSWGGTYKTEGNKIVYSVDIAWVQSWIGSTRTYQAELSGNKLTVTTPTFKSTLDGQDVVVVTTYERVE
jgi:hypothetical protein